MTWSRRSILSGLLLGLLGGQGCHPGRSAGDPELAAQLEQEMFLHGVRGPYRGRVLDADTGQPLVGAAVVARWDRRQFMFVDSQDHFYAAREVVTDATGAFLLPADDLERTAPPWTYRPEFFIYYPGCGFFPRYHVSPKDPEGNLRGLFEGTGVTVTLRRVTDRKARVDVLLGVPPGMVPDEAMPNLIRLMNLEERALGLRPTHTKGK